MPDLLDVMNAVVAVQESLAITSPEPKQVRKAWPYSPPQNQALALPAWTNSWDYIEQKNMGQGGRSASYALHMQFYAGQATNGDDSKIAAIATAFMPQIRVAFGRKNAQGIGGIQLYGDVNGSLVATVNSATLRGGAPTLALLERGGLAYIGLDLFLDVVMPEEFYHS